MWLPPDRPLQQRRGITLVEIAVVSVLLVIVIGVVFDILIEIRRTSLTTQAELNMQSHAVAICDEIEKTLRLSVRPDSLDDNKTSAPLVFARERCTLISSRDFRDNNFYLWDIESRVDPKTEKKTVNLAYKVLDSGRMTGVAREEEKELGAFKEDFSSSVRFQYATDVQPVALEPNYKDQLAPGEYPRLILVRVTVEDLKKKIKPFHLVTAIRLL